MKPDIENIDRCQCGEDLSIERRTDIDELHEVRKAEHVKAHLKEEHAVSYYIGACIAQIAHIPTRIRRLLGL